MQAQVLGKKLGSGREGQVPMPPLDNFSVFFFFRKIAIFVTFIKNYTI